MPSARRCSSALPRAPRPPQSAIPRHHQPRAWPSHPSLPPFAPQLLVDAGADITVTTKRVFTPLEIARGQNNVVSSKPGVAAVLERAQAHPRAPWSSPNSPHSQPSSPPRARGDDVARRPRSSSSD
eukprot:7382783-Prymnesium_polylepis.1